MKRKWPILLGLLLLAAPAAVHAQFTYTTNNGAITLTGYTGTGGAVVISNFVTSIGDSAFYNYFSLTNLAIPASVTNIGVDAFEECTNLATVFFYGNAPTADSTAFAGYTNATVYYLPGATGWSSPYAGLPAIQTTPQVQFTYEANTGAITITGYTGSGGAVVIPPIINGLPVTSIGQEAFEGCTSLTTITIPGSVTNIGYDAFYFCTRLTSVTIPSSVTSIVGYAFEKCTSLTSVTIPASVNSIGDNAFSYCTGLTSVTIPGNIA